jgi:hypothetical protein
MMCLEVACYHCKCLRPASTCLVPVEHERVVSVADYAASLLDIWDALDCILVTMSWPKQSFVGTSWLVPGWFGQYQQVNLERLLEQ